MVETIRLVLNGNDVGVAAGSTVAAAMLQAGVACRTSVSGEPRTALCGMGICYECRATVDGVAHRRTCQMLCREGMSVETSR
jgi:predicted molibdopterin-dependent oxidoreductase YjgC